jgi:hypothetical protein
MPQLPANSGQPFITSSDTSHVKVFSVLTFMLIIALPLLAFVLSIHQMYGGWDDGAITASFARTYAETGRFALTPISEKVEGFSSVSWAYLLAIPYFFFHSSIAILVWMKLLSAVSFMLSLIISRRLAFRLLGSSEQADLSTICIALIGCQMLETLNGMEMNLYMLLVLLLVDVLTGEQPRPRNRLWVGLIAFGLITTRFESPYLIVAIMLGLLLSRERKALLELGTAAATAFVATELWRYHEFGFWMPNTVYAKLQQPYSPPHKWLPMLQVRLEATDDLFYVVGELLLIILLMWAVALVWKRFLLPRLLPPLRLPMCSFMVVLLAIIYWRGSLYLAGDNFTEILRITRVGFELLSIAILLKACLNREASRLVNLMAAIVAAGVAFGILFGKNWGYLGRMILPYLPFLVLAFAYYVRQLTASKFWIRFALIACVLCQLTAWVPLTSYIWFNPNPYVSLKAVERYGKTGDAVRLLAGLDTLSILIPDVGGSSLCCEKLRILDSALLANRYLAHTGYNSMDEYLRKENPQVINAHWPWSETTGIYKSNLLDEYKLYRYR